ncbi:MAG: 4'-phosphopantetheinyl transferase superfamily protein [Spirochaetota bacterium]
MHIAENEIHIWYSFDAEIQDEELLSLYHSTLAPNEAEQQRKFYFAADRHRYLITRALLRSTLSQYAPTIPAQEWYFQENEYGKPFIANESLPEPLHFNISHSKNAVVLAIARIEELGIDVEFMPRPTNFSDIAQNFFSPVEAEHLLSLPEDRQKRRFYDIWTLKEAYIKACGMGLSIPLDHFSFSFSSLEEITVGFVPERGDTPELWNFWQWMPSPEHLSSLAVKSRFAQKDIEISIFESTPFAQILPSKCPISQGHLFSG